MKNASSLVICGLALLIAAASGRAQGFGTYVEVGEDEVYIGESLNDITPGLVYVYRRGADGSWMEHSQLSASDGEPGDHFGRAIAIEGNTMVIGATVWNNTMGAAYVFERESASDAWEEVARVTGADLEEGDAFGRKAALSGGRAFVASWGHNESAGAVYVFKRDDSGTWSQEAKLVGSDVEPENWFGSSIAVDGNVAIIGAFRQNENRGAAYVFRYDEASETWLEETKLVIEDSPENTRLGDSAALKEDRVLLGASGYEQFTGMVYAFAYDAESGEWSEVGRLRPFDATSGAQFGNAIAFDGDDAWVGAPGADGSEGRVYRIHSDGHGGWAEVTKLSARERESGDAYASTLAVRGDLAAIGLTGADYGAGTAVILERGADGSWAEKAELLSEPASFDAVVGGQVDCEGNTAALFDCNEVDLVSFVPVKDIGGGRGVVVNDLWGWTDPSTGKEYAIVGRTDGAAFVDVSDPYNPVYLGELLRTEGSRGSTWRDIKVYKNHAFIVSDGAQQHGMQVFDLTQLREVRGEPVTFSETVHYDNMASAHNIVINESTGFAFTVGSSAGGETCGGGLHMVNIQDPKNPTFAGCFADPNTGNQRTGYTHDAQCVTYQGPDADYQGREICFGSNETALSIADVTDKQNPVAVSSASYPNVAYSHQGWLTEDQRYFYMNDEGDEGSGLVSGTRTLIWDVADLDDPIIAGEYLAETRTTDHNLYVVGQYMYQSNYLSGLRVLDINDPEHPVEVGYFDTVPYGDNGPAQSGSWSNYPFFASGVIVVTSGREGLFVLKKKSTEVLP